jgi:hypothetical protein
MKDASCLSHCVKAVHDPHLFAGVVSLEAVVSASMFAPNTNESMRSRFSVSAVQDPVCVAWLPSCRSGFGASGAVRLRLTTHEGQYLVRAAAPLRMVGQRFRLLQYDRPDICQFGIQRQKRAVGLGELICGKNRLFRTLRHAESAFHAFVRVDHQEVGADVKRIGGADVDAFCMSALNAVIRHYVGHGEFY